ncbi:hypothetical protein ABIC89_002387 [Variovorax boronicumulans]|uniref:hypothetical protein n=1 Tax=Variovorax boronicumulans TaxID=436515 RepID=UPI00339426A8
MLFGVTHHAQSTSEDYGGGCVNEAVESIGAAEGAVGESAAIKINVIPQTVTAMAVFKIILYLSNGLGSRGRHGMRCYTFWTGASCAK